MFEIWKGSSTVGIKLFSYRGNLTDNENTRIWHICTEEGQHTVLMRDTEGNGWGSETSPSLLSFYLYGVLLLRTTMPYQVGKYVYLSSEIFNVNIDVEFGSSVYYKDGDPYSSTWYNRVSSSWYSGLPDELPIMTDISRSYIISLNTPELNELATIIFIIKTKFPFLAYFNGREVYRTHLPIGTIEWSTASSFAPSTETSIHKFSVSKSFVTTTSVGYLGIQVHQNSHGDPNDYRIMDEFNVAAMFIIKESSQCGYSVLVGGTYNCVPATAASPGYGCDRIFDGTTYTYYYSTRRVLTIQYTFNNDEAYWVNSYSLTNSPDDSHGDPQTWTLYGSQYGTSDDLTDVINEGWIQLDYREGFVFSERSQTAMFSLRSNTVSFKRFKLVISTSSKVSSLALSSFKLLPCNYDPISAGLWYARNTINSYVSLDPIVMSPLSSGYTSFSSSPSLPTGLSIDPVSGTIEGMPNTAVTAICVISAYKYDDDVHPANYQFILTFHECETSSMLIKLVKKTTSWAGEESFYVSDISGNILYSSPSYKDNREYTTTMCVSSSLLYFTLEDSLGDGWSNGSYLYIYIKLDDAYTLYQQLYLYDSAYVQYKVNIQATIKSKESAWSYAQGAISSSWYTSNSQGVAFSLYTPSSHVATSTVWLFKKSFIPSSLTFSSYMIRIYARNGFIIYINDKEVYRFSLPTGTLNIFTRPTSSESMPQWFTITLPIRDVHSGSNSLSVGVFNWQLNTTCPIDFDLTMIMMTLSNEISRSWDISTSVSSEASNINALFDYKSNEDCIVELPSISSVVFRFYYGSHHSEYINKYCIISGTNSEDSDPSSWSLFGSDNGNDFNDLSSVNNVHYSFRSQKKCFYIPTNPHPWRYYIFIFTSTYKPNSIPYQLGISEIQFLSENIDNINVNDLSYSPSNIYGYINMPISTIYSNSIYYSNYIISPSLPSPLTFDSSVGVILGTPTTTLSKTQYTITATKPDGTVSSTTINLTIKECILPNQRFLIEMLGGSNGENQGFQINTIYGSTILEYNKVLSNYNNIYSICKEPFQGTISIYDQIGLGWNKGSLSISLYKDILLYKGGIERGKGQIIKELYFGAYISLEQSIWLFSGGNYVDDDWLTIEYDVSDWIEGKAGTFPALNSATEYYRYTLELSSLSLFSSFYIQVQSTIGVVVYINGHELYRYNMPNGIITRTTYALSEYIESQYSGGSFSINNNTLQSGNNIIGIELHRSSKEMNNNDFDCIVYPIMNNNRRLLKGTITSDIDTNDNENQIITLFDNNAGTLSITGPRCVGAMFLFELPHALYEYITSYTITIGPSCNVRHPSGWRLEASKDGIQWSILHVVGDYMFTYYSQSVTFTFFNDQSYHYYKYIVTECNNQPLDDAESLNSCLYPGSTSNYGFQLSELSFNSKTVMKSCYTEEDGGSLDYGYSYISCGIYYEGYKRRYCSNGNYGDLVDYCSLSAPRDISFESQIITAVINQHIKIIPYVQAAEYTCSIEPSLPSGVTFDSKTAIIEGTFTSIIEIERYIITCSNSMGSISKPILISCIENNSSLLYIIIGISCLIIILLLAIILFFCLKKKKHSKSKIKPISKPKSKLVRKTNVTTKSVQPMNISVEVKKDTKKDI
ncbi:hypothetical protein WA158_000038 [Blastocystis sp. Blastoise]